MLLYFLFKSNPFELGGKLISVYFCSFINLGRCVIYFETPYKFFIFAFPVLQVP